MSSIKQKPTIPSTRVPEKTLLVTIQEPQSSATQALVLAEELQSLVTTMGLSSTDSLVVKLTKPHPRYYVGTGKAEEILQRARELEAECIIFNQELTPAQQRNWEELSGLCVIDRHEVILEIFADRASTKEAFLQVGLARAEYSLPRLKRSWTHLSRQRGGMRGTRGEGETQLEVDRRLVLKKIAHLKQELKKVKLYRANQRKLRSGVPLPTAALVGYTNAGKSSLLNKLTNAQVLVEDKLFATLDPCTRKVKLENNPSLLLTDTVGFIRNLPLDLIEAFKSTLEETVLADFLIHVLDGADPQVEDHYRATLAVLEELNARHKPTLTVFNKMDKASDSRQLALLKRLSPEAVFISAATGQGLEELKQAMSGLLTAGLFPVELRIPQTRYDLVALVHRTGQVLEESFEDSVVRLKAQITHKTKSILEEQFQHRGVAGRLQLLSGGERNRFLASPLSSLTP